MKLATIREGETEVSALVFPNGAISIPKIKDNFQLTFEVSNNLFEMIQKSQLKDLNLWVQNLNQDDLVKVLDLIIPSSEIPYAPPFRNPGKIWGIGLNYQEHASDLDASPPSDYPVGFMKPNTTIIGHKQTIQIPKLSERTTGEAELGIIISKECKNIAGDEWLDYVAGFTTIIDMTAEDILRKNARYLGLSKSFNTFFSFGPQILTVDEIENIQDLEVMTVINHESVGKNSVKNMRFPLAHLVSFYSEVMTLQAGDIISTGTPRAGVLKHGDMIECHINGFQPLINTVQDLKI